MPLRALLRSPPLGWPPRGRGQPTTRAPALALDRFVAAIDLLLRFRSRQFDLMGADNRLWKSVYEMMRKSRWKWQYESNNRHYKFCREVRLPSGAVMNQKITLPVTAQDWRAPKNAIAALRNKDREIEEASKNDSKQFTLARRTMRK